ncbi:hypothetical protein KSS87_001071 [Heliosperma pusillum]|nr:hypothetical protein KSS87_001071 [Heliosperma pusillum]
MYIISTNSICYTSQVPSQVKIPFHNTILCACSISLQIILTYNIAYHFHILYNHNVQSVKSIPTIRNIRPKQSHTLLTRAIYYCYYYYYYFENFFENIYLGRSIHGR